MENKPININLRRFSKLPVAFKVCKHLPLDVRQPQQLTILLNLEIAGTVMADIN